MRSDCLNSNWRSCEMSFEVQTRQPAASSDQANSKAAMKTSGRATRDTEPIISGPQFKSVIVIHYTLVIVLGALVAGATASGSGDSNRQQPNGTGPASTTANSKPTPSRQSKQLDQQDQNGFQLHDLYSMSLDQQKQQQQQQQDQQRNPVSTTVTSQSTGGPLSASGDSEGKFNASAAATRGGHRNASSFECPNGLLTFELSTGFIYKPTTADDTLSMMPSTLQLTDCLDYCLHNSSCLAINFEMGLCVLLATSAKQNQQNLHSSQFPVFTIYAEKKCLLTEPSQAKHRRRCQRAWTFERVAGYEMKIKPRRRLKLATKELCMDACLVEREFACRSANWYRQTGECSLSDQDRHSVSQSEAGDQQIKASLSNFYGPHVNASEHQQHQQQQRPAAAGHHQLSFQGFQRYFSPGQPTGSGAMDSLRLNGQLDPTAKLAGSADSNRRLVPFKQLFYRAVVATAASGERGSRAAQPDQPTERQADWQHYADLPVASAAVDYLENNCIYEPNKLCEFRKIQNRVLKTVDSIYQDVATLDECRQKCLNAPYRCYSFDYGDTSERVCRTSHLDQASLLSVNEPYLEVVGAITYELAACFNVSIQCRAKGMVASVSSSKSFNGKIYAKSRPTSCVNDVTNSLQFELSMKYHDDLCDVRASSSQQQGVFSNDIVIQHHDRIVTTQDVGLSVYCQYDLGNRSVTNNVDLAIERLPEGPMESKQQTGVGGQQQQQPSPGGPLTITGLATTVVRSPNVTMRITNMNGQPVTSATVGDRLALLFEIKEKTSPFGILVREIVAMDGRQVGDQAASANSSSWAPGSGGAHHNGSSPHLSHMYHHYASDEHLMGANNSSSLIEANSNSIQFLDRDGCPTDANLMGPLVRMDPQGHRLLAPFDAFKFPSSEMVFFRAVVSSCVAECKPATCSGPNSGPPASASSLGQPDLAPPAYGDLFSPTPADDVVATTRNMPPTTTQQQQRQSDLSTERPAAHSAPPAATSAAAAATTITTMPPSFSTTTLSSTVAPSQLLQQQQQLVRSSSTLAPYEPSRTTKLHNQQEQQRTDPNPGDLLTTVPGFNVNQPTNQLQQLDSTSGTTSELDRAQSAATTSGLLANFAPDNSNELAGSDHSMTINMTNNHNLGRPTPRPMTTTTTRIEGEPLQDDLHARGQQQQQQQSSTSGQTDRRPLPPPPAKLDPLTAQERLAILDLLNSPEKSSQFLSSSGQQRSSSSLVDEQVITSGLMKLYPILESFRHGNSRSRELATGGSAGNQTSRTALLGIKTLISDEFHSSQQQDEGESARGPSPTDGDSSRTASITRQNKIKRSSAEFVPLPPPNLREFSELIYRRPIDYIIAKELKSTLLTQMLIDEAREAAGPNSKGDSEHSRPNAKEARNLADDLDDNEWMQSRQFPAEKLDKFFSTMKWLPLRINGTVAGGAGLTFKQVGKLVKAKFDHELNMEIKNILKLFLNNRIIDGQRQRRAGREKPKDELEGYAYVSQPQFVNLRQSGGPKFTNGHVELYHMDQLHRIKRLAPIIPEEFEAHQQVHQPDQPKYEVEEMIVQSIKIVDRIQFEDEPQKQQQPPINGMMNKYTALKRRPWKKHFRDTDAPQANRQLGDEDSIADDPSERHLDGGQPIKSRLSAINILLVAMCFIFIQISMVLLCLINWNNQRRKRQNRRSLFADLTPFKTVDRSTISSSMTYSDCSNYR